MHLASGHGFAVGYNASKKVIEFMMSNCFTVSRSDYPDYIQVSGTTKQHKDMKRPPGCDINNINN